MGKGVALMVSALLVLAACDGGDGERTATAGATTTGATTTATRPCEAGGRSMTLQGVRVRQFCGPAMAQVTIGEETLRFPAGECARHEDWLAVNLGFEVIDPEPDDALLDPELRSFTVLMGRHPLAAPDAAPVTADGVYSDALITFAVPGRSYLVDDKTVTLVGTRTAGAFSGIGFLGDGEEAPLDIEGVFTCDATAIPLEAVPGLVETLARE